MSLKIFFSLGADARGESAKTPKDVWATQRCLKRDKNGASEERPREP
jgi:hypothetical protein